MGCMWEGEKSNMKSGNMRSPSKTQLVKIIIKAWNHITEDKIIHSFIVCSQGDDLLAEEVLCMRKGRS